VRPAPVAATLLAFSASALLLLAPPAAAAGPDVDRRVGDPRITESSGLAVSPTHAGVLWTHDDSGNPPLLFALAPSGRITSTTRITGLPNVDWEAMAAFRDPAGRAWLAAADIGDNQAQRPSVEVDVVPEPARLGADVEPARLRLRLRYPDGPRDAETLLVDSSRRRMWIVSKGLFTGTVYAVPSSAWDGTLPDRPTARSATLVPVGTVPLVLVTDGTVAPDGTVLLRTYGDLAAFDPFPVDPGGRFLTPRATGGLPSQQQGEGLALEPDGRSVLLSSEGSDQAVLRVPLPDDIRALLGPPPATPSPAATRPSRSPSASSHPAPAVVPDREDGGLLRVGALTGGAIAALAAVVALTVAAVGVRRRPANGNRGPRRPRT